MNVRWLVQFSIACFILDLDTAKIASFRPYLTPISENYTFMSSIVYANLSICILAVFCKSVTFNRIELSCRFLILISLVDLVLSAAALCLNGYGMSINEYRWIVCDTSTPCESLSPYGWFTVIEMIIAAAILLYSLFMLVYVPYTVYKHDKKINNHNRY